MHPTLLCLKGHPGTGKSTLAQALASHLRWPLLDKDDIKDHTWPLANGNDLSYVILWQMVERQLAIGLSVIVDSPMARPALYQTVCEIANRHGVRLLMVQVELEETLWQARLAQRSLSPSAHKPSSWAAMQQQLAAYEGCWHYPIDPAHLLVVDLSKPIERVVEEICLRLT